MDIGLELAVHLVVAYVGQLILEVAVEIPGHHLEDVVHHEDGIVLARVVGVLVQGVDVGDVEAAGQGGIHDALALVGVHGHGQGELAVSSILQIKVDQLVLAVGIHIHADGLAVVFVGRHSGAGVGQGQGFPPQAIVLVAVGQGVPFDGQQLQGDDAEGVAVAHGRRIPPGDGLAAASRGQSHEGSPLGIADEGAVVGVGRRVGIRGCRHLLRPDGQDGEGKAQQYQNGQNDDIKTGFQRVFFIHNDSPFLSMEKEY